MKGHMREVLNDIINDIEMSEELVTAEDDWKRYLKLAREHDLLLNDIRDRLQDLLD